MQNTAEELSKISDFMSKIRESLEEDFRALNNMKDETIANKLKNKKIIISSMNSLVVGISRLEKLAASLPKPKTEIDIKRDKEIVMDYIEMYNKYTRPNIIRNSEEGSQNPNQEPIKPGIIEPRIRQL